jgi:chemotaxis signal transduction protein
MGAPVGARFLRGIGKVGERFVLILDTDAVIGGDALRSAWQELAALAPRASEA